MPWVISSVELEVPDSVWLNLFVAQHLRPNLLVSEPEQALLTRQLDDVTEHRSNSALLRTVRLPIYCLSCLAELGEEDGGGIRLACHHCRSAAGDWGQRFLNIHASYNRNFNQPGVAVAYLGNLIKFRETGQRDYYAKYTL